MQSAHESSPVLSVSRGSNQQWHVTAGDCRQPLASFDDPQTACAWAIARAKPSHGRVFVEELAATASAYAHAGANSSRVFKFSIPVTLQDGANSRTGSVRR